MSVRYAAIAPAAAEDQFLPDAIQTEERGREDQEGSVQAAFEPNRMSRTLQKLIAERISGTNMSLLFLNRAFLFSLFFPFALFSLLFSTLLLLILLNFFIL